MSSTAVAFIPGEKRKLKNHTSITQTVRNSLVMAYRG